MFLKYNGIKVMEVSPIIYLGEKFKNNGCQKNQRYVADIFQIANINEKIADGEWGIECPIDDMVYVYLGYGEEYDEEKGQDVDIRGLLKSYEFLSELFSNVKINLYLDGYYEDTNSIDMTIEEFREYIKPFYEPKKIDEEIMDSFYGDLNK